RSAGSQVADITTATSGFEIDSATQIRARVPVGATTGRISVANPAGIGFTTGTVSRFTVAPRISSFTPTNGPATSIVTIFGANFIGATDVQFNGTSAGPMVSDI